MTAFLSSLHGGRGGSKVRNKATMPPATVTRAARAASPFPGLIRERQPCLGGRPGGLLPVASFFGWPARVLGIWGRVSQRNVAITFFVLSSFRRHGFGLP